MLNMKYIKLLLRRRIQFNMHLQMNPATEDTIPALRTKQKKGVNFSPTLIQIPSKLHICRMVVMQSDSQIRACWIF